MGNGSWSLIDLAYCNLVVNIGKVGIAKQTSLVYDVKILPSCERLAEPWG